MNPKNAKLSCHTGALAGTEIKVTRDILIGRQPSCDLVLYPHSVSGQHARLYFSTDDGHYYIEDLGSSNGTWVDRTRVDRPIKLDSLNVITFANDIDFIFHCSDATSSSGPKAFIDPTVFEAPPGNRGMKQSTEYQQSFSPPPAIPQDPPKKQQPKKRPQTEFMESFTPPPSFEAPPKQKPPKEKPPKEKPPKDDTVYQKKFTPPPDLNQGAKDRTVYNKSFEKPPSFAAPKERPKKLQLVINTKGNKEQFTLRPGKNSIGRSSSADITIADPFISSSHAIIEVKQDGRIVLEDQGSSNKTYVNGQSITKPVVVQKGMQIRFGPNSEASIISS